MSMTVWSDTLRATIKASRDAKQPRVASWLIQLLLAKAHYLLVSLRGGDAFWSVTDSQWRGINMQTQKWEFFQVFAVISSTSLLTLLPVSWNHLSITAAVTAIHLESLRKLYPSYALYYARDHVFALALPRHLEETVHKCIIINFLKKKTKKLSNVLSP